VEKKRILWLMMTGNPDRFKNLPSVIVSCRIGDPCLPDDAESDQTPENLVNHGQDSVNFKVQLSGILDNNYTVSILRI